MRVRLSDARATEALRRHLEREGFPARRVRGDELDVLFPGSPSLFPSAAQLDLWHVRHEGVTVRCDGAGRGARTPAARLPRPAPGSTLRTDLRYAGDAT